MKKRIAACLSATALATALALAVPSTASAAQLKWGCSIGGNWIVVNTSTAQGLNWFYGPYTCRCIGAW